MALNLYEKLMNDAHEKLPCDPKELKVI